jgi:hypothetical protein
LQACAESADNRAIKRKLLAASQLIAAGGGVSDSLARQPLFPPLVLRMVHTGEANGALAEALENVAWFFERDSKETVDPRPEAARAGPGRHARPDARLASAFRIPAHLSDHRGVAAMTPMRPPWIQPGER